MSALYHQEPLFVLTKVCPVCNDEKPAKQFKKSSMCEKCRYKRKKERVAQSPLATEPRECRACSTVKPIEEFYRESKILGGYSKVCKECDDKRKRQWDREHRDHIRTQRQAKYDPEERRRYNQAYYAANRDQIYEYHHLYYEAHKEDLSIQSKQWQQANLLKCRESNDRRRAIKRKATIEKIDYQHILERDAGYCYICEKDIIEGDKISFDHVIPLHRGGAHVEANLRLVHATCNSRKRFRLLSEMTPFQRRGIR